MHDCKGPGAALLATKIARQHMIFSYGDMLRIVSLNHLYHRICLTCEDETSPPLRKLIVTCCDGYGWKQIIVLMSRVTKGRRIEHLLGMRVSLSISRSHVIILSAIQVTNFTKCVREL